MASVIRMSTKYLKLRSEAANDGAVPALFTLQIDPSAFAHRIAEVRRLELLATCNDPPPQFYV